MGRQGVDTHFLEQPHHESANKCLLDKLATNPVGMRPKDPRDIWIAIFIKATRIRRWSIMLLCFTIRPLPYCTNTFPLRIAPNECTRSVFFDCHEVPFGVETHRDDRIVLHAFECTYFACEIRIQWEGAHLPLGPFKPYYPPINYYIFAILNFCSGS